MKKAIHISFFSIFLVLILLLVSCGQTNELVYDKDRNAYVREDDGALFYRASLNYRAVKIDKAEQVGAIAQPKRDDLPLYAICNYAETSYRNSNEWMADEDYHIYYAQGVTLPKLWEMDIEEIQIVKRATVSYSMGTVTAKDTIGKVVDSYQNGFSVSYDDTKCNFALVDAESNELAFCASDYSEIYYILQLHRFEENILLTDRVENPDEFTPAIDRPYTLEEYGEDTYVRYNLGKNFVFDLTTGLYYPVDGLFDSFFNNSAS